MTHWHIVSEYGHPWENEIHLLLQGGSVHELRALWKQHGIRFARCLEVEPSMNRWPPRLQERLKGTGISWNTALPVLTIFQSDMDLFAAKFLL